MVSYPNQKSVVVHRNMPNKTKTTGRNYMIVYTDIIENASKNLKKPSSFKLFMYLVSNQDNYYSNLSTQDFSNTYGISLDSAKDAVNDLIEKGYLVLREKHLYDFYEYPQTSNIDFVPEEAKTKTFTNQKTGEKITLTYEQTIEKFGSINGEKLWRNAK